MRRAQRSMTGCRSRSRLKRTTRLDIAKYAVGHVKICCAAMRVKCAAAPAAQYALATCISAVHAHCQRLVMKLRRRRVRRRERGETWSRLRCRRIGWITWTDRQAWRELLRARVRCSPWVECRLVP